MSNREDEYYDSNGQRPARRRDEYGDYGEREMRRTASGRTGSRSAGSRGTAPRSTASRGGAGNGGSRNGGGSRGGSRKKKNNTKAIILLVVEVIVACILVYLAYTLFFKVDVTKVGKVEMNEQVINDSINEGVADNDQMKGYTNIALFGVDARDGQLTKNTRSDSIIIASINNDTGEIKLCSVYRDTYLNLSNDTYTKCNAAYAQGGPEQAISMLNMNLDMDIEDFITIGFSGLTDVVNKLGGVEIDVTEAEISHLNNYQSTMATELKMDYTAVTSPGRQTLNGLQATAYCRIRYTAGDDFRRAERQRTVLMACLEKAQGKSLSELEEIANAAFNETYTSLDLSEIIDLLGNVPKYKVVDNNGFPYEDMRATGTMGKSGSCVLPTDLQSNVKWLHQFLFNDADYEVTDDVKKYSDKIQADVNKYLN